MRGLDRVLALAGDVLEACGFLVVVVRGAPSHDATEVAASSHTSTAAEQGVGGRPIVLIVQDSHLLPPGRLEMLAGVRGLAVVAAQVQAGPEALFRPGLKRAAAAAPRRTSQVAIPTKGRRIASLLIGSGLAWLALALFIWEAAQRVRWWGAQPIEPAKVAAQPVANAIGDIDQAPESPQPSARPSEIPLDTEPPPEPPPPAAPAAPTPVQPRPSMAVVVTPHAAAPLAMLSDGAPGLLIRAKPGETLQILYRRVYRGVTPPPFAEVAAKNPEPIRPGDILIFPAPANGWHTGDY